MFILLSGPDLRHYKKLFKYTFKGSQRVLYVPAWYGKKSKKDYKEFQKSVKNLNWQVEFFPIDRKLNNIDRMVFDQSEIVVIDGGNTFFLQHHLNKSGFGQWLKKSNKNIIGLSAGAIVMTPSIRMAKYPKSTADDNFVNLKNLKGLGLVNFEVHVHATNNIKEIEEVAACARRSKNSIYCLKDKDYIIVRKKHGKISRFELNRFSKKLTGKS